MADVKWIKITTDIFDDEKILLIENLPEADSIIVIWFKLLCLAGKMNNSGVFIMNDKIAYTEKMLATIFRRKETTVQMALRTFEQFGMVELIDGVITIPNWGKHQNLEALEARREYQRKYHQEYRKKQKMLMEPEETSDNKCLRKRLRNDDVNAIDKEEDKEEDKDKEKEEGKEENITCRQIVDMYNSLCPSLPAIRSLSESRKKAIKARLRSYTAKDFETVFKKAEASGFLKGRNNRNWSANFDWLIKDSSFAKVLDGNYDDTQKNAAQNATKGTEVHKTWGEAWDDVMKSISNYGSYREVEALNSLDPLTRAAATAIGYKSICLSDRPDIVRGQFRMIYEQLAQRSADK